jgi:hypothetical protein
MPGAIAEDRCDWVQGWTDQIAGSDLVLWSRATQTPKGVEGRTPGIKQ